MRAFLRRLAPLILGALCVFSGPARAGVFGDVDADCDIDVADAVLLERYLAGLASLTNEQATNASLAPVGGVRDDVIDSGDLVTLRRIIAGELSKPAPAYSAPVLDSVAPTAPGNPIPVSGTVASPVSGMEVVLYVNGRELPYTAAVNQTTGEFEFDSVSGSNGFARVPLVDGENRITAIVRKGIAHSCSSAPQTTTYHPATVLTGTALEFSGTLPQATMVWTLELSGGMPYLVTGDLTIRNGQSLYIQPGVQVKFALGAALKVEPPVYPATTGGNLKILGAPDQLVVLGPNGSCSSSTRWDGIEVSENESPSTQIRYAKIDCVTTGFHVASGGSGSFVNGVISRFTDAGIRSSQGAHFAGSSFNTLTGSAGSNVGIEVNAPNTFIRGNTISGANVGIKANVTQQQLIERNVITGNATAGISIAGTTSSVFSRNTITRNCRGVALEASTTQPRPKFIGNSIFDNNHICGCSGTGACRDYSFASGAAYQCSPLPPPGWLDATGNWWGSNSLSVVQGRISQPCTSNPIDYTPLLEAPYDQVGFFVSSTNLLASANLILGQVHDGNKPAPAAEWLVVGTVTVPAGQTFTIPDGQVVKFSRYSELVVDGTLVVEDQNGSDAIFTALMPPGGIPSAGDWQGIRIQGAGTATIAGAVIEYATRGIQATDADFVLRDSLIESFSDVAVYLDGSSSATVLQRNLIDNFPDADDHASPGTATGTGVWLVDASPVLQGNEIQDVQYGIRAVGDSLPTIDGTTADGPNSIHHTTFGIWLEGTGDFGDPHSPDLVGFHENQLFSNGTNLQLSFTVGGGSAIDATNNYWGVTTEAGIRATITNTNPDVAPASVDISNFLDQNMNVVGGAGVFTSLLSGVGISKRSFAPTLLANPPNEDPLIGFTLAAPATVSLKMFAETVDDPGTATPVKTLLDAASLAAGPHAIPWDGTDASGVVVADEAYAFHLTASNVSLSETYFPPRPTLSGGVGQQHGDFASTNPDPYANLFSKVNYNLDFDGRVKVWVDPDCVRNPPNAACPIALDTGVLPAFLAFSKPLLARPFVNSSSPYYYFVFDGRYPDTYATNPGRVIENPTGTGTRITFPVPQTLRANFVIVERTRPEVKGPELSTTPSTYFPRIEVRPNPYFITHSYNQFSTIRYCVDQSSLVTIKVLPFGAVTPSEGMPLTSEITVFSGPKSAISSCTSATAHSATFDLTGGGTENVDLDGEGAHTFTIEAVSQGDPSFKTLYRGSLHQQR